MDFRSLSFDAPHKLPRGKAAMASMPSCKGVGEFSSFYFVRLQVLTLGYFLPGLGALTDCIQPQATWPCHSQILFQAPYFTP